MNFLKDIEQFSLTGIKNPTSSSEQIAELSVLSVIQPVFTGDLRCTGIKLDVRDTGLTRPMGFLPSWSLYSLGGGRSTAKYV